MSKILVNTKISKTLSFVCSGYGEELIDHIEDETISAFQRMMMRLASVS